MAPRAPRTAQSPSWVERCNGGTLTYVAGDQAFCIYLAESEAAIRQHAELSGIPVTRVVEVPQIIDPLTAAN